MLYMLILVSLTATPFVREFVIRSSNNYLLIKIHTYFSQSFRQHHYDAIIMCFSAAVLRALSSLRYLLVVVEGGRVVCVVAVSREG